MEYMFPHSAYAGASLVLLAAFALLSLLFAAQRILFALAAYHDAQAAENPDAVIWGLAIGFLGAIPGIIYLCIRGTGRRVVRCPRCGWPHAAADYCCPKCGEKNPEASGGNPYAPVLQMRARRELIGGIVAVGVGVLLAALAVVLLGFATMRFGRLY